MKRLLLALFLIFLFVIIVIPLKFESALFQEGNPIPILRAIHDLNRSNIDYEQFAETNQHKRFVSANTGDVRYDVIKKFLNEQGWDFKEQLGSGLVFEKEKKSLVVETRQYSKHYILWSVPNEVFN